MQHLQSTCLSNYNLFTFAIHIHLFNCYFFAIRNNQILKFVLYKLGESNKWTNSLKCPFEMTNFKICTLLSVDLYL